MYAVGASTMDCLFLADKAEGPLLAGRADGVQPRFLEILHSRGLAEEVHEEGPLLDHTVIYKDGQKLYYNRSHQSDSRYQGLHIITQGQIERIYIRIYYDTRDLLSDVPLLIRSRRKIQDTGLIQCGLRSGTKRLARRRLFVQSFLWVPMEQEAVYESSWTYPLMA